MFETLNDQAKNSPPTQITTQNFRILFPNQNSGVEQRNWYHFSSIFLLDITYN